MGKRIVIALGGNAIKQPEEEGKAEEQLKNIQNTAEEIKKIVKAGHEVVITHGNGPQVGSLLIQQEAAKEEVPAMPLDVCGSQTQGQIGYMIQQALREKLEQVEIDNSVISVITQVLVDEDDEAFKNPAKPVGPFYGEKHAKKMIEKKDEDWIEDAGRGWRKVVPSPIPKGILEIDAIKSLVKTGAIVIASGGGGIPVIKHEDGTYQGVEAVIDKDRAGEQLAEEIEADIFMVLTEVPYAALNFNTPEQKNLNVTKVSEMKKYLQEGHFADGSMGPKVESALEFVENGGQKAIITSLDNGLKALNKNNGTIIIPDNCEEFDSSKGYEETLAASNF
ncbi:carbamate kinase [Selenihalanaerobacter shriftii]|uniref:Carbamate kinase n=1 Tax=Selenihalanaerobacter shriftii TaxID=142842 RepID=A0A1T4PIQ8_9FIRM|nr:carbamate kinase [Selenihalanaerobacter shriftii]SJZ91389.1 carbamate kinase [Selenihalanaerobacter shriftii]